MDFLSTLDQTLLFGTRVLNQHLLLLLLIRFGINFTVAYLIIRKIYFYSNPDKNHFFAFLMINQLIFFVCFLMSNANLSLGFGFGLFAIFSILRYRADELPVKDMTYLFVVVTIAVINSVVSKEVGYIEILITNGIILLCLAVIERFWMPKQLITKNINYEKIDLIKPQNRAALLQDLKDRTGLNIINVKVQKIDFLQDTALLRIYYLEENGL